jgi:hypothetical protein
MRYRFGYADIVEWLAERGLRSCANTNRWRRWKARQSS